uniref:Uncharacterized protein n=2 Tax=Gloeothece TaxID=28070 RepID=E0ULI4_GLOV7|nr:hypothetical protein Cyan7822_5965 [Gloeothece verrucosa PCC 7822]
MPNQLQISHYINYYQKILEQLKLSVSSRELKVLLPLVNLIFEVDSLYDIKEKTFARSEVEDLREKMSILLSESSSLTQPAIEHFFKAIEEESDEAPLLSLKEYLQISRYSIGAELLSNYIAYILNISPAIWFSKKITSFREEIYTLIRLANDYLDVKGEQPRKEKEKEQVKAIQFFSNPLLFQGYFLVRYIFHKLNYYFFQVQSFLNLIFKKENEELKAIICAESILIWAYKVYVIDQNSVHQF